ncbi:hypothetical protein ACQPW3_30585 [Actinosynnema sp. CA-248983]
MGATGESAEVDPPAAKVGAEALGDTTGALGDTLAAEAPGDKAGALDEKAGADVLDGKV